MASLIGDILFAIIRVTIWRWSSTLVFKLLTRLEPKMPGRRMKMVFGGALGLAAFILVLIFAEFGSTEVKITYSGR